MLILISSVFVLISSVFVLISSVFILISSVFVLISSAFVLISSVFVLISSVFILISSVFILMVVVSCEVDIDSSSRSTSVKMTGLRKKLTVCLTFVSSLTSGFLLSGTGTMHGQSRSVAMATLYQSDVFKREVPWTYVVSMLYMTWVGLPLVEPFC